MKYEMLLFGGDFLDDSHFDGIGSTQIPGSLQCATAVIIIRQIVADLSNL